jgi:hypothetical protein
LKPIVREACPARIAGDFDKRWATNIQNEVPVNGNVHCFSKLSAWSLFFEIGEAGAEEVTA